MVVTINKKRNVVVAVDDRATFEIVLHRTWKGSAVHQDFLGFYVLDSHRMSARTHGLLGMAGWVGRGVGWGVEANVLTDPGAQERPISNGVILVQGLSLNKTVIEHTVKHKLREPGHEWGRSQVSKQKVLEGSRDLVNGVEHCHSAHVWVFLLVLLSLSTCPSNLSFLTRSLWLWK
jgi:hypothetical protein